VLKVITTKARRATLMGLAPLCLVLAGCATPDGSIAPGDVFDPFEENNRQTHELNRALDKALVRPVGVGYTKIVPDDLEDSIGNFAANLGTPGTVVNNLLQGDLEGAFTNTMRFVFNTTLGFGGLFDVASDFQIEEVKADFGQTLYVWGVPEGAKYIGTGAGVASKVGDRGRYAETVDSVLYNSADSYSQARGIYLQNRRFELGDGDAAEEIDPFDLDTEGF